VNYLVEYEFMEVIDGHAYII